MSTYRHALPQLNGDNFLTDGGLETTLVYKQNLDLPCFAAFVLIDSAEGQQVLTEYFETYLRIALNNKAGFILEASTWRASKDWGDLLGYDAAALANSNRKWISFLERIRNDYLHPDCPLVISACIGPRGDGYTPGQQMSPTEAADYHSEQIATLAATNTDMINAMTINYPEEAIGITLAAQKHNVPVCISFTVETDGRLPIGITLKDAIEQVDAATSNGPVYYMINCAHPDHFSHALEGDWVNRIRALRANASRMSHAELDEATELDDGNPKEFGELHARLIQRFPHINILGGCCGTDDRHISEIGKSCCGVHSAAA